MSETIVTITIRKTVATTEQGEALLSTIKAKLADNPDVKIVGKVTTTCTDDE